MPGVLDPHNDITDEGWWLKEEKETDGECMTRVKQVMIEIRGMARENEGKKIVMVTHGYWLN